jgi:hypothetical protein
MVGRAALRFLGLAVLVLGFVACGRNDSLTTAEGTGPSTKPASSLLGQPSLADSELSEILAVAVPTAIAANPDGHGKVVATQYSIADSLGSVTGDSVTFAGNEPPLSQGVREAIAAGVSPGSAVFVPADPTKAMLLIATPVVEGDSVVVTYQQPCGGEPGALCGSGGAFRMERGADGWRLAEVLSGWIS